jgi:hypothetical protein
MKVLWRTAAVVCTFVVAACDFGASDNSGELDSKSQYSVLQAYEFDYRGKEHSQPVIAVPGALGTKYDVIGFPKKSGSVGYVWFIANGSPRQPVMRMPSDGQFLVDRSALDAARKVVRVSYELDQYLLQTTESP